jgi:hypothetical protein
VIGVAVLWGATLAAVVVTYARIDPVELYHVSHTGLVGGLSRALVLLNFPISLVAIGVALVVLPALPPGRARRMAVPAIALCAVTAVPGVVEQDDLDARPVNLLPALGVVVVAGLAVAALRRTGPGLARRRPLDPVRIAVGVVVIAVSLPWLAAELGFFLPEGVFVMERAGLDDDGVPIAAVHLGHHHGLDGAFIVLSALALSRRVTAGGGLALLTSAYLGLALAYGAVNATQDAWNEQLAKRGTVDWEIPSALEPRPTVVWLVVLVLAALCAAALCREACRRPPG